MPSANKESEWFVETASTKASVSETRSVPPPIQPMPTTEECVAGAVVFCSAIGFIGVYGFISIFLAFWLGWHGNENHNFRGIACWILAAPLGFALSCLGLKNGWVPVGILLGSVYFASHAIYYFS